MALKFQDEPILYPGPEKSLEYKRQQKMIITCSVCGNTSIKYRMNIKNPILCRSCCQKKSFQNKDWSERNAKSEQTKLIKYGNPKYVNPEKIKESLNNRSDEQKDSTKEKVRQTNLTRYDGHPASRQSQKERTKQTCIERYGVISPSLDPKIKLKLKETMIRKYGVDNAFKSEEIKEHIRQTCIERYGVDNPRKSQLFDSKIKQTCLERYGVDHPWKDHDIRIKCQQSYEYDGLCFDSSWELYVYIYLIDHNIEFRYQPDVSFLYLDGRKYFPDFEIEGKYYEIKGDQFFEDGKMINPYDRSVDYIYEAKHQCMIDNNVIIWRRNDLNHIFEYVDNKYTKDYVKLFKTDVQFPFPNTFNDKDSTIRYFHKSIYYANRKGFKSPYESWSDKKKIKKSALNRLKYVGKCTPSDVLYGFNVAKIAPKVSVFSYKTAIYIVDKYLNDYTDIVDPFSGFSARMMAVCDTDKHYTGFDISNIHIQESTTLKDHMGYGRCELSVEDIFEHTESYHECLFTCPPYGDKEMWGDPIQNKSCDEWIDVCLSKYKCKRYVFVVDDTVKYKDYVVEEIINKSHLNTNKEYIIVI